MSEIIYTWIWLFIAFLIVHPWAAVVLYLIAGLCVWDFIYTLHRTQEK